MPWWNQFSESKLEDVEKTILSALKTEYDVRFVRVPWYWTGEWAEIRTISLSTDKRNKPLVLLHGFAAGIGFWVKNLDAISEDRPVHAIDLVGFSRSSRLVFSTDSLTAEREMVDCIERWRQRMDIDKFILLGHSMGGYLATSYAISYPERVEHLILADPWGFADKSNAPPRNPSLKFKILGTILYPFTNFNPLATVRALGPFGPWFIKKMRGDILSKFDEIFEDNSVIADYIYHCNAQDPTGETAFHSMIEGFGWAKNPMIHRIKDLKKDIPITFIYGSKTWMDVVGPEVKEMRRDSFVDIKIIEEAGHHIYSDQPAEFNRIVVETCNNVDSEKSDLQILTPKNGNHNLKGKEQLEAVLKEDQ